MIEMTRTYESRPPLDVLVSTYGLHSSMTLVNLSTMTNDLYHRVLPVIEWGIINSWTGMWGGIVGHTHLMIMYGIVSPISCEIWWTPRQRSRCMKWKFFHCVPITSNFRKKKSNLRVYIIGDSGVFIWRMDSKCSIYTKRLAKQTKNIIGNDFHPLSGYFELMPSGRRYKSVPTKTVRLTNSFVPSAIHAINKSSQSRSLAHFYCITARFSHFFIVLQLYLHTFLFYYR